jgi:hypothetical protein
MEVLDTIRLRENRVTTKELTPIVSANTLAIAEHNKAMAEINKTIAENNKAIAQLTNGLLAAKENIDRLAGVVETVAASVASHDEQIASLARQWQAYVNTLPRS